MWLKRALGDIQPSLFSTPQTPKSKEIVAYAHERSARQNLRVALENYESDWCGSERVQVRASNYEPGKVRLGASEIRYFVKEEEDEDRHDEGTDH